MKKNKFLNFLSLIILSSIAANNLNAEIIIFSACENKKDGFLKNEYVLDLNKSIMTRSYIYNEKTFNKYRMNDLSVKKENSIERFIYIENELILTDKIGYPQFYTQLVFEVDSPTIVIKTVINNEEGSRILSTCKKIERFEKES